MFMHKNTQYHQDFSPSQLDLEVLCNPNKNRSKLYCGNQQTDSKVYTERQKTQNSQPSIEGEQNLMTYTTQLRDLLDCGIGERVENRAIDQLEN